MPFCPIRPTRRGLLVAGGYVTLASAAGVAGAQLHEDEDSTFDVPAKVREADPRPVAHADRFDPEQRYLNLVGGPDGVLYAVQADGKLTWHRHTGWRRGTADWASGSGRFIDAGWHRFRNVLGGNDGSLYGVRGDGVIVHRRYVLSNDETGEGTLTAEREIGSGFERFSRVIGYDGHIFGLTSVGSICYFRHDPGTGRLVGGRQVLNNLRALHYGADTDGVIYSYWQNGLSTLRYLGDEHGWVNGGASYQIAKDIYETAEFGAMFFAGSGRVYFVPPSDPGAVNEGRLLLHRIDNYADAAQTQTAHWAGAAPILAGTGWTVGAQASLQGYPLSQSVANGQPARIAVSTTFVRVAASIVRLDTAGLGPQVMLAGVPVEANLQQMRTGYVHHGCGWRETLTANVGTDWPSGVYAARLEATDGLVRHVPFVVRPSAPSQPTAVILATNTYMAYNSFGGHSQYCGCSHMRGRRRTLSFHRPYPHEMTDLGGRWDHTLPADLTLLRWMSTQDIGYDVYTDEDLDREPGLLDSYRVAVLPTHPEYYSERQREQVLAHQRRGGSTLYLGGNGIYERVSFSDDRSALVFRKQNGARDVWNSLSRPASQLVGTNWNSNNYWTFAPYKVVRDHPLLRDTGLSVGAMFGAYGDNGPASGGEIDCRLGMPGEPDDSCVIAVGQNPGGGGAEMIVQEGRQGGFLFSASSISFTGALFASEGVSRLLRNVFQYALART